jgi:beta-barrel assembly-enhancing protease
MFFRGTLHNRDTQQSTPVTIRLQPGMMLIQPEFGPSIEWLLADLQSARKTADGLVILQSGRQFLEVEEPGFAADLERVFPGNRLFRPVVSNRAAGVGCLVGILFVLALLVGAYIWLIPWAVDRAARLVSTDVERQVGEGVYESLTEQYEFDTLQSRRVQTFFDSLGYASRYAIRISVVKEASVNAFALPGGRIVVFDGILRAMDRPEQLAALLGHEMSHVELRHSTRAVFRQLASSLFFSLILGDYGDVSVIVAQEGDRLTELSYSRSLELEADAHGFQLMQQSRIPTRGMRDLLQKLKDGEPSEASEVPHFLSTHPSLEERMQVVEEKIAAAGATAADSVRPALQQMWRHIKGI